MLCATFNASELADIQGHLLVNVAARRASLTAWEEPIRNANFLAVPVGFVFQHRPEHAEAGATDVLGEAMVFDHATDVEVFDCQNIEPANQIGRQLV